MYFVQMQTQIQNIFPDLDSIALKTLEEVGQVRTFEAGSLILDAGQYIRSTILVLSGQLKVYRTDDEGNEHLLYLLDAGQACALSMICAIKQEKSELQAVALSQVSLLLLPLPVMEQLMRENRSWYHFVLSSYRKRFEEVLQLVDQIAFKALDERLVFYLKKLVKSQQSKRLNVTHEGIARDLSSSRVVISRLLKQLENKGKLKLHRNEIEILNL